MGSFAEKRNGRGKKKKGSNIWFPFFFSFLVLPCGPEKKKEKNWGKFFFPAGLLLSMNPVEGGNYHISMYAYASTHILLIPPTTYGFFSFSFFFFSDSVCDFCYVTINNLKNT